MHSASFLLILTNLYLMWVSFRIFVTIHGCPPLIAVGFRELGTQQEDLGRVKDPYQDDDERSRGAVGGRHIIASNVKADQMLADREQQGRYSPTQPNLFPFHWVIREYFEHHGEKHGRETKRQREVYDVQNGREPG